MAEISLPPGATQIVNDPVRDILRYIQSASPDEVRRVEFALKNSMGGAITATTVNDVYRVPETHKLAITEIRGHLALLAITAEVAFAGGLIADTTLLGHILAKAMNCRLQLKVNDTSLLVTDSTSDNTISLASILEIAGAKGLDWSLCPFVVKGGQTLRMDAALIDAAASIVGAATEYGIHVSGFLMRTKGD